MPLIEAAKAWESYSRVVEDQHGKSRFVDTYYHVMHACDMPATAFDEVDSYRRVNRQQHDEMQALKKAIAKTGDYATARQIGDEAGAAMRRYRAACLVLPYCGSAPKDCPVIPWRLWPVELAPELDYILDGLDFGWSLGRAAMTEVKR